MNTLCKTGIGLLLAFCVMSGTFGQIPPPPPTAGVNPPPPGAPGMGPVREPGRGPGGQLQQLIAVSGTVTDYLSNDRYIYDGFTLQNSGQTLTVRFPAHLAEKLMRAAKKGAAVSVQGFYEVSPDGANEFHLVNAEAGGSVLTDMPPAAPATPPAEVQQQYSGTIKDLRRNRDGVADGILIGDKEVVDLPPGVSAQLQVLLKPGLAISGTGTKVVLPAGVVMARDMETIRPQTITINGQTYLAR